MAPPSATTASRQRLLVAAALRRAMAAARSPAALGAAAAERLRAVVAAARDVEPYRTRWAGAPVDRVDGPGDLAMLPIVDRTDIASLPIDRGLTVPRGEVQVLESSGTSGMLLQSTQTAQEAAEQDALRGRAYRFQGVPEDAPFLGVELGPNRTAPLRRFGRDARIGAAAVAEDQLAAFREIAPQVVHGPPSILADLAERMSPPSLRALLTASEQLGPELRRELRDAYGADPLDNYGATEVGAVSWQCERRDGYHVNADAVVVEVVGEDGLPVPAGVTGELVITALWNTSAPVVRHRVGDLGALVGGRCPCGIGFPLMAQPGGAPTTASWWPTGGGSRRGECRWDACPTTSPWSGATGSRSGRRPSSWSRSSGTSDAPLGSPSACATSTLRRSGPSCAWRCENWTRYRPGRASRA